MKPGRPSSWRLAFVILAALASAPPAHSGGGPENVLLAVNPASIDSLTVANTYIALRDIPAVNVVFLTNVPTGGTIKVGDFRESILRPLLAAAEKRGLAAQIDYVVYSAGFPFAVDVSSDIGTQKLPPYLTQPASLTGLTYLYEPVLATNLAYLAMDANAYMRLPAVLRRDTPWSAAETAQRAKLDRVFEAWHAAEREAAAHSKTVDVTRYMSEAAGILRGLSVSHPSNPETLYNLACVLALQGKPDEAMTALRGAFDAGWWNADHSMDDPDLKSLRGRDDFKTLVERMRQRVVEVAPAQPFRHATAWGGGAGARAAGAGHRYLLSAMLGYTGAAANSPGEVIECLRRSRAADGACPTGTVYFMVSTDQARTGPRQWAFHAAAETLRRMGVHAEVLPGVLPTHRADVAGTMIGTANFDWKGAQSTIRPGAFCDHLTSFGGVMTGGGHTLLSEFIRYGAAGACGTVTEPYNLQAKFPVAFVQVHYAAGCSLAEAFYQSVAGPYQQLLVGDPLCQPWARAPTVSVKGLVAGEVLRRRCTLAPRAETTLPVARFDLLVDGVVRATCGPQGALDFDPLGLAAGWHEARVVAVAGRLETHGQVVVPFLCGTSRVEAAGWPSAVESATGAVVRLAVRAPGAKRCAVLHAGREVGGAAGADAPVPVPVVALGAGPVRLQPVAWLADGSEVRGEPRMLDVR